MRMLFLMFMTCFGVTLFASEGTIFRDEDTGFVMEIPAGMKRTWNISNSDNGMEITVFEPIESGEKVCVVTTGKVPLKAMTGEGSEGLFPFMIEQVKATMQTLQEDEELPFQIEELPSLANEEYCGQRFRLCIMDEDWDEPIRVDVHAFVVETYSFVVTTLVSPCVDEEELDDFTNMILGGVRFIEIEEEA